METPICDFVRAYAAGNPARMHMPGHKGEALLGPEMLDLTEIEGFDDLHQPTGLIQKEQKRLAKASGARESFLLVGGSSAGVKAAICSQTRQKDKILLARNAHKSAYHAVYFNDLKPLYLYPSMENAQYQIPGPIPPSQVKEAMAKSGVKVVCITSPSYEGILSDIRSIADIVHENGGLLIVDEAHGAHLSYLAPYADGELVKSAVNLGADIVIQSLHKTLPAMTQTAVLYVGGDRREEPDPNEDYHESMLDIIKGFFLCQLR